MAEDRTLLDEWLATVPEEPIEAHFEIIDPHHHLWDPPVQPKGVISALYRLDNLRLPRLLCCRSRRGHRWLLRRLLCLLWPEGRGLLNHLGGRNELRGPSMLDRYMMEEFRRDLEGNNVVKTVYVECGWRPDGVPNALQPVGEADMVRKCAEEDPLGRPNGMVAFADLSLGVEVEETLKQYKERGVVRGIRHVLAFYEDATLVHCDGAVAPSRDFSRAEKFHEGFALLAKYGFTFDTGLYHVNVPALADLARAFPGTTVICDHVATPIGLGPFAEKRSTSVFETWKEHMRDLASCPNVCVKLSGLGMGSCGFGFHERRRPPGSEELAEAFGPYYRHCVELFGFERCMFASNFPVDKISGSYTAHWNAFKRICSAAGYSEEQKRQLLRGTAERVYRL